MSRLNRSHGAAPNTTIELTRFAPQRIVRVRPQELRGTVMEKAHRSASLMSFMERSSPNR